MRDYFHYFKSAFGLGFVLSNANFKLRNEGNWLGVFWYLTGPIATFFVLLGIFNDRLGNSIPNYPLYLFLGIIMFNFFQKTTGDCSGAIRGCGLLKSLNFPREALIFSILVRNFYSHLFEVAALIVLMLYFGLPLSGMVFYPLVFVLLCVLAVGFGLILAAVCVHVFDFSNVWGFLAGLLWFATPIFYSIGGQDRLAFANQFNPMYYLITIARELIVYSRIPSPQLVFGSVVFSLAFLIIGLFVFKKLKPKFAELI